MRILILGSRGRLAAALAKQWSGAHDVTALSRAEVDVADLDGLERALDERRFDVLVNGTGMTNVDLCETEPDLAATVNARAPAIMAKAARAQAARLIHFSTDYVFDGKKATPYVEEDAPGPLCVYARTKCDGEQNVLSDSPSHLVVRVSWVFGPEKPSFLDMIIAQARDGKPLAAVADKFSAPTFTSDVSEWLTPFFETSRPGGLLHACNSGSCSWYDYATHALRCAAEIGVPLATNTISPLLLKDMTQFVAPRPIFTTLSTEKLTHLTGTTPRAWQEAVQEFITKKYAPILSTT